MAASPLGFDFELIELDTSALDDSRRVVNDLASLVRETDAIVPRHGQVLAVVACDRAGAVAVAARLRQAVGDQHSIAVLAESSASASYTAVLRAAALGEIDIRPRSGREVRGAVRILVIDDDEDVRDLLEVALARENREVVAASSAEEGQACFEALAPHILITDNDLPGMSGVELSRRLRESGVACPIILHTGRAGHDLNAAADQLGLRIVLKGAPVELLTAVHNLSRRILLTGDDPPRQEASARLHRRSQDRRD
jgi:CheY-like chemotaxis protein